MKDKMHMQAAGRRAVSLCRPGQLGGSSMRLTVDWGRVDCVNCLGRRGSEGAPQKSSPPARTRRSSPPAVTVDDLEAAVWQSFAKLGLRGDPDLAAGIVKHVLVVAKEWALSCGASESQLGIPAPVWDSLDGILIRKKRGRKEFAPQPGKFRPDKGGYRECRRCRRWLKMAEFHKDSKRNGGHRTRCRDCIAETRRRELIKAA